MESDKDEIAMRAFTPEDISTHIDALTKFVGEERIKRSVATWRNSIQKSPPLVSAHREQESFYWWPGFVNYWESKATGAPYTMATVLLAKDATKILDVLETMPESIKVKYAAALGDGRNTAAYLFELNMAHHFMSFGHTIQWIEDTGRGIAEFIVVTPTIEFEVECKHISVDAGRLITRQEFSRFAALVEDAMRKRRVMGNVRLMLDDRLPKLSADLEQMASMIGAAFDEGGGVGQLALPPWGTAIIQLSPANDAAIDWEEAQSIMRAAKPKQGHAFMHAQKLNDQPVNTILVTLETAKRDEYLRAIYDTLKDAAKRQLSKVRPGVLCVHIPEIRDFSGLLEESGLHNMTAYFFSKDGNAHICAVSYSSDPRIIWEPTGYRFTTDALAYKNANCRFPYANQIRLFSHETVPPELRESELEDMKVFDTEVRQRNTGET
jgi:hypothetical protein